MMITQGNADQQKDTEMGDGDARGAVATEARKPSASGYAHSCLLDALSVLSGSRKKSPFTDLKHLTTFHVANAFSHPTVKPLDVYRAAACLREGQLKEIVQLMVFSGPAAVPSALRLLNVMRGLPGNWELTMELLEQQEPEHLARLELRVMTLIALLGGKKVYRLCDWDPVIERALREGHEESRLAIHMVVGRKWKSPVETVYRVFDWQSEFQYADRPSVWREIRWAACARSFCEKVAIREQECAAQAEQVLEPTARREDPCFELLPAGFGVAAQHYVRVCGFLMRRRSFDNGTGLQPTDEMIHVQSANGLGQSDSFVTTPSVRNVLRMMAMAIGYGMPVVLEGSTGCGKTSVISLLARKTLYRKPSHEQEVPGVTFIQMDSAMSESDGDTFASLVGSIVPLPEGGGFRWRPGPIGMAVERGEWVVFENIGKASNRVSSAIPIISQLAALRPGDTLNAPGRGGPLKAGIGFRCIATRTVLDATKYESWEPPGGWEAWQRVAMQSLSDGDKVEVLKQRFPRIEDCVARVVKCSEQVSKYVQKHRGPMSREPTLRETVRICNRLNELRSESGKLLTVENALLETLDVLTAWCPNEEQRRTLLDLLSACWSLPADVAGDLFSRHRPTFSCLGRSVRVGRSSVARAFSEGAKDSHRLTLTGHTLRLMERTLRCLQVGEQVLLTGEAGTGKTALIQELATILGKKLIVVNLSRQSELGDLVGGFRPLEIAAAVPQLAKKFEAAFCLSMSRKKNGPFLDALQRASRSLRQHARALRLMRGAMDAIPREAKNAGAGLNQTWGAIAYELEQISKSIAPSSAVMQAEESECLGYGLADVCEPPAKRRKGTLGTSSSDGQKPLDRPKKRARRKPMKRRVDFRFSEGVLVRAMRDGHWVLLDEINLAPAEVLERLVSVVDRGQVVLPNENGDVVTHSEGFKLFGAMNPPTDVGKRPLPAVLRTRFSEFYAGDMLERSDIILLTLHRFFGISPSEVRQDVKERVIADDVATFFIQCCALGREGRLEESSGKPVRYSLRSLSRMLDFASGIGTFMSRSIKAVRRSLYEGAILAFATPLPLGSRSVVTEVALSTLLGTSRKKMSRFEDLVSLLSIPPSLKGFVRQVQGFLVLLQKEQVMPNEPREGKISFVISPSVRETLQDVARALALGTPRLPVLLQGPTAAGKTSLVAYLAEITGNRLVRINNHEHTDLSEYIGGYVVTPDGSLVFHEGPLVQAARSGSWVLLDELNLAPPEVLESLNRLLDDNREIFLPETGEMVQAADGFMVFATQNPPGLYGGRKELSRAFKSRFVEIQVEELSDEDLLLILENRCRIPQSFATKMISVMRELQIRRRETSLFAGREGFVTARDLFRWASRGPRSKQELAVHGFFLLGERSRCAAEREVVRSILLKVIGVEAHVLDERSLYSFEELPGGRTPSQDCLDFSLQKLVLTRDLLSQALYSERIVPTSQMRRMLTLMLHGAANCEPALLIGFTGGGKTSCCHVIARALQAHLLTVNCHRHTEASDILGSFRPARSREDKGRLFEWINGPLVTAMQQGSFLLIDEINMAEDAVIERLNSVLELERTLLLSEKGAVSSNAANLHGSLVSEVIRADSMFRIFATMNPGGDFGKKELSPALRNRFTEIWIPPPCTIDEYVPIIQRTLSVADSSFPKTAMQDAGHSVCDFLAWSLSEYRVHAKSKKEGVLLARYAAMEPRFLLSIRDVAAWCDFIKGAVLTCGLDPILAFVHGARLVFLDGLSVGSTSTSDKSLESAIWKQLLSLVSESRRAAAEAATFANAALRTDGDHQVGLIGCPGMLNFECFSIPRKPESEAGAQLPENSSFSFDAPCTVRNSARLARAMAVGSRPILLEGPPGCGKSSLVTALANAAGYSFVRINLSQSTEMSDLVGMDSPGEAPGTFAFREGPLLAALRKGSWLLLDELNLASQSVLEGLNSVLDHRRSVFVPELSQEVVASTSFRVFGAQNPAVDGGGRRGLPRSFLNRFTRVQIEAPSEDDILAIVRSLYPFMEIITARKIIRVLHEIRMDLQGAGHIVDLSSFGLRDALRWCDLLNGVCDPYPNDGQGVVPSALTHRFEIGLYFDVVVLQGLREGDERTIAEQSFHKVFGFSWQIAPSVPSLGSSNHGLVRVGHALLGRSDATFSFERLEPACGRLIAARFRELQALSFAVNAGWPAVVYANSSKVSEKECIEVVQTLATLCGKSVTAVHGGSLSDCDDFVGGYSQEDVVHMMETMLQVSDLIVLRCVDISVSGEQPISDGVIGCLASARMHEAGLRSIHAMVVSQNGILDDPTDKFLQTGEALCSSVLSLAVVDSCLLKHVQRLRQLHSKLDDLRSSQRQDSIALFEWHKSEFIDAIENGDWILLQAADSCPPAILDRLNPILERPPVAIGGGKSLLPYRQPRPVVLAEAPANQDGSPVFMRPHPDFRIFFSCASGTGSPTYHGLSRALLDRSLRVHICPIQKLEANVSSELARTRLRAESADGAERKNEQGHGKSLWSSSPLSPQSTSVLQRYRLATGDILLFPRERREGLTGEMKHSNSADETPGSVPRTYEVDFALNPRLELIERDLVGMHVAETESLQVLGNLGASAAPLLPGRNGTFISIDRNSRLSGEDRCRGMVVRATAEGFLLASQSRLDIERRCRVLRIKAERTQSSVLQGLYIEMAVCGEDLCQSTMFRDYEALEDQLGDLTAVPIDPIYASDRSSIFFIDQSRHESSKLALTMAKRFRIEVLALQSFRSSWNHATQPSQRKPGLSGSIFCRAKVSYEVRSVNARSPSGSHICEVASYGVLLGIAASVDPVLRNMETSVDWEIRGERRLVQLFLAARELCDIMISSVESQIPELYCRLMEIVDLVTAIFELTGDSSFVTSRFLASSLETQLVRMKPESCKRHVLLLPRTESGQLLEARMLAIASFRSRTLLSLNELDGLVKALATLSTNHAEGDQGVLDLLEKVANRIGTSKSLDGMTSDGLQHWNRATFINAVNCFQNAVMFIPESKALGYPKGSQDEVLHLVLDALFHAKCIPRIRLSFVVALQQIYWALECLQQEHSSEHRSVSFRELKILVMSGYLTERATALLGDVASGQGSHQEDGIYHGVTSSVLMLAQDPAYCRFWNLSSARRESLSAMTLVTTGRHVLRDCIDHSAQLLTESLRSVLSYADLMPEQELSRLGNGKTPQSYRALLTTALDEVKKRDRPFDRLDLFQLQAQSIADVGKAVAEATLGRNVQRETFLRKELNEMLCRGTAWISIGLFRLRTYEVITLQRNGVDPSDIAQARASLNLKRSLQAGANVAGYVVLAKHRLGGDDPLQSTVVRRMEADFTEAMDLYRDAEQRSVFRPTDRPSFQSFVATVSSLNSVITNKIVRGGLISRLASHNVNFEHHWQAREEGFDVYRSCAEMAETLELTGPLSHFRDLSSHLQLALRELQFGLASCLRASEMERVLSTTRGGRTTQLFWDIIPFPRAAVKLVPSICEVLQRCVAAEVNASALMACVEYLVNCETVGVIPNNTEVSKAMSTIVRLWKRSSLYEEEDRKKKNSIHVLREAAKTEEMPGHGVVESLNNGEEQDFIDTFNPISEEHENALLGIGGGTERHDRPEPVSAEEAALRFQTNLEGDAFWNMHKRVFPACIGNSPEQGGLQARISVVHGLSANLFSICEEVRAVVDHVPTPWDVFCSIDVARRLDQEAMKGSEFSSGKRREMVRVPYNFYRDSNVGELLRSSACLRNLQNSVTRIQKEHFVDSGLHPVLAEVSFAIDRVASTCNASSPLSSVVLGIENVVRKADAWHRLFATSATRMDAEVLALSIVIARWRRLEMDSWKLLLENRVHTQAVRASKWFFFLYDAILHEGTSHACQGNKESMKGVVSTIDQFLRSSPCGEFDKRLEMVLSLGTHLLSISDSRGKSIRPLGCALRGIGQYYSLFARVVSEERRDAIRVIQTKLDDFSRLISWDPDPSLGSSTKMSKEREKHLEYYRLKTAAERTKRRLHKLCLEVDASLHVPVYDYLTKEIRRVGFDTLISEGKDHGPKSVMNSRVRGGAFAEDILVSVRKLVSDLSGACEDLNTKLPNLVIDPGMRYLSRLQALHSRVQQFGKMIMESTSAKCDLATQFSMKIRSIIRSRSLHLRQSKELGIQPKKRALVELLKTLQRVGLSPFENAILAENLEPYVWLSSPDPSYSEAYNGLAGNLFYVGAQQLRRLREVSDSRLRSTDITAGEAQRFRAFCGHLFDQACTERRCISELLAGVKFVLEASSTLRQLTLQNSSQGNPQSRCDVDTLLKMARIADSLQKICLDLDVSASSLRVAFQASKDAAPAANPKYSSEALIHQQLSVTRVELSQLQEILGRAVGTIRAFLTSPEVLRMISSYHRTVLIIDDAWALAFFEAWEHLKQVKNELETQLLQAEAISRDNLVVQVLSPTICFVCESIESIEAASVRQTKCEEEDTCGIAAEIEATCELLVERTLVGAQNVMEWNEVRRESLDHSEIESKHTNQGSLPDDSLLIPRLLRTAHDDVVSLQVRSNIDEIGVVLRRNIALLRRYLAARVPSGERPCEVMRLQQAIGSYLDSYIKSMIMPCVQKVGLFHCHSLSLLRTLSSIFAGVCLEGFCRPSDEVEDNKGQSEVEDHAGIGFGDVGEGDVSTAQDVSEQIEDEEQLLGLQNDSHEQASDPTMPQSEQDKGFEMSAEFDGNFQDLDVKDEEDKDERAREEDIQMATGEGKGDDVVDERLWKDQDTASEAGSTDKGDASTAVAENQQLDLVANDLTEHSEGSSAQRNGEPSREEAQLQTDEKENVGEKEASEQGQKNSVDIETEERSSSRQKGEEDMGADEKDVENQDEHPAKVDGEAQDAVQQGVEGANDIQNNELDDRLQEDEVIYPDSVVADEDIPMTGVGDHSTESGEAVRQGNQTDTIDAMKDEKLPDNLSLDGIQQGSEDDEDGKMEGEELVSDPSCEAPSGEENEEGLDQRGDSLSKKDAENRISPPPLADSDMAEIETEGAALPQSLRTGNRNSVPQTARLELGTRTTTQEMSGDEAGRRSAFQSTGGTDVNGMSEQEADVQAEGAGGKEGAASTGKDGGGISNVQELQDQTTAESKRGAEDLQPNPFRATQGDELISGWSKYLNIMQTEADEPELANAGSHGDRGDDGMWQFKNEDDSNNDDKLGLGAATDEQHRPLSANESRKGEADEDTTDPSNEKIFDLTPESIHGAEYATASPAVPPDHRRHLEGHPEIAAVKSEEIDDELGTQRTHPARKAAELCEDVKQSPGTPKTKFSNTLSKHEETKVTDVDEEDKQGVLGGEALGLMPVGGRLTWDTEELSGDEAASLWRKLNQLCSTGASILCEQLRLVLEPTITSGLAGGYRTGKRLNIRKVIEFVASDYRKDRIWLRRVRPDKRSYDVLLAIDDSESMSESEAGPMAIESLALVTSALSKLEIGRIAVASFGAETRMVRGFNEPLPFDDTRGGQLLQHFRFSQGETDISKLLQFIQSEMGDLGCEGDFDHIKLAFVISDGRLSGRDEIKKRLRRLKELNVLVAFIIVDKVRDKEASIYDVRRVEYDDSGKIQVLPYMQDFPIDFYAIVQDVKLLPIVLADALRQWVEITSVQL